MFQKHDTFNFGYQFWFLGPTTRIFTKLVLCNIILKKSNFIIYIEGPLSIYIIYIGIIRPQSCLESTKFRASLVIEIINFNEIKKTAHLAMLVIFYVDVIFSQIFNLPHIIASLLKKLFFRMKIYKLVTWYPNMVHIM